VSWRSTTPSTRYEEERGEDEGGGGGECGGGCSGGNLGGGDKHCDIAVLRYFFGEREKKRERENQGCCAGRDERIRAIMVGQEPITFETN
jgi:hypothetical protein